MSSSKDTAFVLVPGAFCRGSMFSKVVDKLVPLGYTTVALDNPTTSGAEPPSDFYDDAANVNKTIASLADQGKDVVIVGNSYGGFIITQAGQGLSKADRKAKGKSGGLVAVVYLASLLAPMGITCHELISGEIDIPTQTMESYMQPPDAKAAGAMCFSDLNEEDQEYWGGQMVPMAPGANSKRLTYLSYEHCPTTVLSPKRDVCVKPDWVKRNVDEALARGVKNVSLVSIEGDHCPQVSRPDELVEALLDIAKNV